MTKLKTCRHTVVEASPTCFDRQLSESRQMLQLESEELGEELSLLVVVAEPLPFAHQ